MDAILCERKESDLRPLSYQDSVLPLNYARKSKNNTESRRFSRLPDLIRRGYARSKKTIAKTGAQSKIIQTKNPSRGLLFFEVKI